VTTEYAGILSEIWITHFLYSVVKVYSCLPITRFAMRLDCIPQISVKKII